MRKVFLKTVCAAAAIIAAAMPVAAADFTFKFAHAQPPTSVRHKSMELFKDNLEKDAGLLLAKEMTAAGYQIDVARI